MCGGCPICGQTTYGALGHATREQCVGALKTTLASAQEGREMVRETLTAERDRYREALVSIRHYVDMERLPQVDRIIARVDRALDDQREAPEGGTQGP